jgi:HSP20 family molecular chaperone IbpA
MTLIGALYPRNSFDATRWLPTIAFYKVEEEENSLYYEVPLPGFSKEEVSIVRKNGTLRISASHPDDPERRGRKKYVTGGEVLTEYSHAVRIEDDAKVEYAKLTDGVLTIKITWQPREPPEFKIDIT